MQEERRHGSDRFLALEGFQERRQPARLDERVRVEEAEVTAGGKRDALVRRRGEPDVVLVCDDRGADETLFEQCGGAVGRGVVNNDQLEERVRVLDQRRDRVDGGHSTTVCHHHDGDERRCGLLQGQGLQCRRSAAAIRRSGSV